MLQGVYGYPIEIQALFFMALRCALSMLKHDAEGKECIERIVKRLDVKAAEVSRDSMAKNLYSKLFDWLVAAINRKISALGRKFILFFSL